jgi:hypothetical protein
MVSSATDTHDIFIMYSFHDLLVNNTSKKRRGGMVDVKVRTYISVILLFFTKRKTFSYVVAFMMSKPTVLIIL